LIGKVTFIMSSSPAANPSADLSMAAARESVSTVIPHKQTSWLPASLAIFILASICFIFHLGVGPLAGTEGHRAITAEQMLHNGNYILPQLYGHLYMTKPPLTYWLIALSERCFGPGELTWRLPSALASALLAAGICAITAAWFDSLAGLAAGIAFIGIIPLWSQDRSADVDAINHLGSVLAALAIIDMTQRVGRIRLWSICVAALGTAVCGLSKGPAGLPIILGAAIGPALANRELRPLRRPQIYVAIVLGALPFAIWAALAYHAIGRSVVSSDMSGAVEARKQMLMILNIRHLPQVLSLPFVVLAYGMPISALLVLPVVPAFRKSFDLDKQRLLRAIVGSVLAAFIIQMCTGMINPRYAFLNLPLLCPLAGAMVFVWRHNDSSRFSRGTILTWLTLITFAYCGAAGMILYLGWRMGFHSHLSLIIVLLGLVFSAALLGKVLWKVAWCAALAGIAICAAAMIYGLYKSTEESVRSAKPQAAALAAHVSTGAPIVTWNALWSQPEYFYYAHLHPEVAHPLPGWKLPNKAWLVLDDEEWSEWQAHPDFASHLSKVAILHPYKHVVYACWYSK
jgi:4-amino-4-deoxy-L-arabinose transferase-like glycosyltransferase